MFSLVSLKTRINITVMANYDASNTNKSKKSTRTYVDLDLDFTRHPVTNDVVKITDVEAVKRSVKKFN